VCRKRGNHADTEITDQRSPTFTAVLVALIIRVPAISASPEASAQVAASPDNRQTTDGKSIVSVENPNAGPVPIAQLYYTRSTFGSAWSPDGREVVFTTNLTGRANLWRVSAAGGFPIQLQQSDNPQSGAVWSPDGKWIVFEQDFGGGELYDLFAVSSDGELINLTNTPDISESDAHWSPDGRTLAIAYRPKDSSNTDIALLDWKSRRVSKLTLEQTRNREWFRAIWGAHGKTIFADRANAGHTDSDVYCDIHAGFRALHAPVQWIDGSGTPGFLAAAIALPSGAVSPATPIPLAAPPLDWSAWPAR
jgi:dipeptidyl aminopeptidase/acylaminoacyl peptidase